MSNKPRFATYLMPSVTWLLRIVIGATFIISGLSKMIDVWGFVYKIEQYLNVWGWDMTRQLVVISAMTLSSVEFVVGLMLFTGCYKRAASWGAIAIMALMLPLSTYIMIANPVDDCGCFGDFLVISNTATFFKNLAITAGLIYLCIYNKLTFGLFHPYLQWIVATVGYVYIMIIGLVGYNLQPLIDFRPYKVGASLVADDMDSESKFEFVYEKDGVRQTFNVDNLPDSTWTFVDRIAVGDDSGVIEEPHSIEIYDLDDENVTDDVIPANGKQVILLIPEIEHADISYSFLINEMYNYVRDNGWDMIGVFASDDKAQIEQWVDLSLAQWPVYTAEDTSIKELARGKISVVYLKDGVIEWKRTLSSIPSDMFSNHDVNDAFDRLYPMYNANFTYITNVFVKIVLSIFVLNLLIMAVKFLFSRKKEKKNVTLRNNSENVNSN